MQSNLFVTIGVFVMGHLSDQQPKIVCAHSHCGTIVPMSESAECRGPRLGRMVIAQVCRPVYRLLLVSDRTIFAPFPRKNTYRPSCQLVELIFMPLLRLIE